MKVEICTKFEDTPTGKRPFVIIMADEKVFAVEALEERIRAMQIARLWLKRETAKK